jgi:hypothetical protein
MKNDIFLNHLNAIGSAQHRIPHPSNEDVYEDEEIDKASVKTVVKFPDEWRP